MLSMPSVAPKLHPYQGEMLTIRQIADRRKLSLSGVRFRLKHGIDLDAPWQNDKASKFEYKGQEVTYAQYAEMEGCSVNTAWSRRTRGTLEVDSHRTGQARNRSREYRESIGWETLIDRDTSFDDDDKCWYVIACHPDGLSLDEIGQLINCTRERVRQIELTALRKLRALGITDKDLVRMREAGARLSELRDKAAAKDNPALAGASYMVPPTAIPQSKRYSGKVR
jgi:hypothetical protein